MYTLCHFSIVILCQFYSFLSVITEFCLFRDDKNIQVNRQVGHMLRSKLSSADEGGVAAGSGALDSPYLV